MAGACVIRLLLRPWWCPFCAERCDDQASATHHALHRCAPAELPSETPVGFEWVCTDCDKTFHTIQSANGHLKGVV